MTRISSTFVRPVDLFHDLSPKYHLTTATSMALSRLAGLQRPRSADPFLGPWRTPFDQLMSMADFEELDSDAETWLAYLEQQSQSQMQSPRRVLELLLRGSPAIQRHRYNPLSPEDVLEVYDHIAASYEQALHTGVQQQAAVVSWYLQTAVERDRRARNDGPIVNRFRSSQHTLRAFRSLAEFSHFSRARSLGRLLCSFLEDHFSWIVDTNSDISLYQWCEAIIRSSADVRSRQEYLRRFARVCADLQHTLSSAFSTDLNDLHALIIQRIEVLRYGHLNRAPWDYDVDDVSFRSGRRSLQQLINDGLYDPRERDIGRLQTEARFHQDQADLYRRRLGQLGTGRNTGVHGFTRPWLSSE